MSTAAPPVGPVFDHLLRMTDARGLFEHALFADPRPEHGYCVDDVARALLVVCREPSPSPALAAAGSRYLDMTLAAVAPNGRCHNRMSTDGTWTDTPGVGDWWGRALWGLGAAAARAPTAAARARALLGFRALARGRSPHARASAFAALGAGELLAGRPDEIAARRLLHQAISRLGGPGQRSGWDWPEPRLTYGNGSVVEALLVAGSTLPDPHVLARGLALLDFLLRTETRQGRLSVTPVGGRGPDDVGAGFDQQPIEVAALADACARAFDLTGDARWRDGVRDAWAWFLGANDAGTPMVDAHTGAGFDGLLAGGRNGNQGAESTLAVLTTAQHARRLGVLS